MAIRTMWAVLTVDGALKQYARGAGRLFDTQAAAQRGATKDGDAVVEVLIDLDREPAFIRRKKLDVGT